jgi:decaprenylphospho-beta-D-ribofuranose 2-oxidase
MTRVHTQEDLERAVARADASSTPILARGLGRSYGDAAQCAGGTLLDCTSLDRIIAADFDNGVVRVEAGISIDSLLRNIVPNGWFVPVTPGTRQVTVGGAVAADVHGKNHHFDGAFGVHVERIALVTGKGRVEASPSIHAALYWATVGGMGLTGALAEVDLRLRRIETAFMRVDTERASDLESCMALLEASDDRHQYSVAWVDGAARGRHLGRSVISQGEHARLADIPSAKRVHPLDYRAATAMNMPMTAPFNLVVPAAIRAGNEFWFRNAPTRSAGQIQSLASFFYPLDAVANWNRLYGPHGFTQYQFVVPFGAEETIRTVIERLHEARLTPSLGVLKRFGDADLAPLSFPMPGWTLALDLPLSGAPIGPTLDVLDELVAGVGGRVYLAKDGRLRPQLLAAMYPRLDEWRAMRERVDIAGTFISDLARRLGLVEQ